VKDFEEELQPATRGPTMQAPVQLTAENFERVGMLLNLADVNFNVLTSEVRS
jgi:hypothetical protein